MISRRADSSAGKDSEEHTRTDCQAHAEKQHRHIDVEIGLVGKGIFGQPGHDESQRPVGQHHAQSRADQGKQQRLRQQLPHNPEAAGSHRRAHRQFVLPRRAPRQQQNRNIAATNRQQQGHRPEKQIKRAPKVAHVILAHSSNRDPKLLRVGIRPLLFELLQQGTNLRFGGFGPTPGFSFRFAS